jgi:hypothetical protein
MAAAAVSVAGAVTIASTVPPALAKPRVLQ